MLQATSTRCDVHDKGLPPTGPSSPRPRPPHRQQPPRRRAHPSDPTQSWLGDRSLGRDRTFARPPVLPPRAASQGDFVEKDLSRLIILEQQEQRTRRFPCGASAKDAKDGASTNARLRGGRARCHRHFHDHRIIILNIIVLIISIILNTPLLLIVIITAGGGARAQGEGRAWPRRGW